jgi:hypothetical protein
VEKSSYFDFDIAAAPAIPIGITISIHSQFMESSFVVAGDVKDDGVKDDGVKDDGVKDETTDGIVTP